MNQFSHIDYLVTQVQGGDKRAFKELYSLHAKAMLNTAFRIVRDDALAEDAVQNAFVSAFVNIKKLKDGSSFSGWLKRIVINQSIQLEKLKIFQPIDQIEGRADESEEEWWKEIPFSCIEKEILNLPDRSRIVLSLYALEGLTHLEIAEYLGISNSTSKSQYQYALKRLKSALKKMKQYEI